MAHNHNLQLLLLLVVTQKGNVGNAQETKSLKKENL
jgi:hypothetical protein